MKGILRNYRAGWATNSSSTHSIVIVHTPIQDRNVKPYEYLDDNFVLASEEEKARYIDAQLLQSLKNWMGDAVMAHILSSVGKVDIPLVDVIDHQSHLALPRSMAEPERLDAAFIRELREFVKDPRIAIFGDAFDETLLKHGTIWEGIAPLRMFKSYLSRKNGNYWYLLDPKLGDRVRLMLSLDDTEPIAKWPELIDVKITERCDVDCPFCYQGAGPLGKHADKEYLATLADVIPAGTEVAIGGGDPMKHPDIIKFLGWLHDSHIFANLTVNDVSWLEDDNLVDAVNKYVSAIGVSMTGKDSLTKVLRIIQACPDVALNFHLIPNLLGRKQLYEIIVELDELVKDKMMYRTRPSVVLLGFKETGRGANVRHRKIARLPELMRAWRSGFHHMNFGVDTKLISDYPLITRIANWRLFTLFEGQYSMYIDAVKQTAHKSSYQVDKSVDVPFRHDASPQELADVFEKVKQL